eukprot:1168114-Pyramimonas_sp.AAC.1
MGPRSAVLGWGDARGLRPWDLGWDSIGGHEMLHWVGLTHVGCANGTVGGAFYGATKRCIGWGGRARAAPLGPSVELLMGPRSAILVEGDGRRIHSNRGL